MNLPLRMQDPGSSDAYTLSRFNVQTAGDYYELGDYLDAAKPFFWPGYAATDQKLAWRAECSRCEGGGVIVITRHTTSHGGIIGAAMARPTAFDHEAELVVNVASYDVERLQNVQLEALRLECARMGLVLGRAETKRIWVAL